MKYLILTFLLVFAFVGCETTTIDNGRDGQLSINEIIENQNDRVTEEQQSSSDTDFDQFSKPEQNEEYAVLKTNLGEIKIRFFPQYAPKAVENFITHAKNDYYDGIIFHRVIDDFMIQGGDPNGTGTGGESIFGEAFEDEFDPNVRNYRGALSMANSGPNTNGSQFFIVQNTNLDANSKAFVENNTAYTQTVKDHYLEYGGTPWLDDVHTVFGQVFEGLEVMDAIASVEVNQNNAPLEKVIIEDILIEMF